MPAMWKHASAVMELDEAVESWIRFHLNVCMKAGRPFFGRRERKHAAAASSLRVGPRIGSGCHDCEDEDEDDDEPLSLVLVMTVIPTMNRRKKEKRKKDKPKEMNMILMLPLLMTAMMNSSTSQPFTC